MRSEPPRREAITGVILAGGAARRMGGRDKGLVPFLGRPLIDWVIAALAPQVGGLLISANRNRVLYAAHGYPVVADAGEGFEGPLAGFAAALAVVKTPWILTVPCDGPCLAPDLVERLCAALRDPAAEIAVASDGERVQRVYALIPAALRASLDAFLAAGEREVGRWYARHRIAVADLRDRPLAFANVNSEFERAALEQALTGAGRLGG
jgi:molybdopterin-guanine dinucleotide biosynthesis protein A